MTQHLTALLDAALADIHAGRLDDGFSAVFLGLNRARHLSPPEEWRAALERYIRPHPLHDVALQDPMTRRAFLKPRGYAGDAVLLDYMYRLRDADLAQLPPQALAVHRFLVEGPAPRAVRYRLGVLANLLSDVQRATDNGRALAIACGHLRELALVDRGARPAEVVALDQDVESLDHVVTTYHQDAVTARRGTVRDLLARRLDLGHFDLVYASGLYDYLQTSTAIALTGRMIELTRPGGTVFIANFTPDTPDIGFMEAISAWHLIYRTEADMLDVIQQADVTRRVAGVRTWRDPDGCIVFAEMRLSDTAHG